MIAEPASALAGSASETVANDLKSVRDKMCFGYLDPEALSGPIYFCFSSYSHTMSHDRKLRENRTTNTHTFQVSDAFA